MPNSQLQILRKESLGYKHFVRCELARRDCFIVLDPLAGVNQDRRRFFDDRVILRPLCQNIARGIHQIDLDALVAREIKSDRSLGQICQRHLNCELANFRELYGLGRDLQIEGEPTQPRILVLQNDVWRKRMKNSIQPTSFTRWRGRGRDVLAKHGPGHKTYQNEQENAALHEALDKPKIFLDCKIPFKSFMNWRMLSESIGMKTLRVLALCLVFALSNGFGKQRHCTFRVHAQANPQDTEAFSTAARAQAYGKDLAIEKMPWISERDVAAFFPYPAQDGTYGALFQLDEHGRVVLDTLSIERRGGFLFVFVNGRLITELQIDRRVSDGKIYIPSGLSASDTELMKKEWRLIGQRKR